MNARIETRPMGLVLGMSMADYHAVDALSASGLRELARSPWHYKNRVQIVPTRPMLNGTLAHCAILEPEALNERYVVVPEGAPAKPTEAQWNAKKSNESSMAAKEWWTAFGEDIAGRTIVKANDFAITQLQLAAVAENPVISELLSDGVGEASVFWIDEATGVYCKARPDWMRNDGRVVRAMDLKSTADESPSGFGRAAARMGYHRQEAHYTEGIERVMGMKVESFTFAVVTGVRPVLAVPYLLPVDFTEQGRGEVRELYELYARCKATDTWPAYGSGHMLAEIPAYAFDNTEVEISDVI